MSELDASAETEAAAAPERGPTALAETLPPLEPSVAALCLPISEADPCGPDLDLTGDGEYLNFLAQIEGILPTSFFSLDEGKPFDPSTFDLQGYLATTNKLLARSRDLRLLLIRARLLVLNRDLAGFAVTLAAVAECLDRYWDAVHPRPEGDDLTARRATIAALDLPTVIFPLQYAPLFEARRTGTVTYRSWIVATGEVKSRPGDVVVSAAFISEAVTTADPATLAPARKHLALLDASVQRIGQAFDSHGDAAGLDNLPMQVRKMRTFIDPDAARTAAPQSQQPSENDPAQSWRSGTSPDVAAASLTSINDAKQALAAIAEYYTHAEPSSPALPLVRQAHQLIGKSFLEIMTILVPSHVDKAAFQIGTNPVFDLPVSKLSFLAANPADIEVSALASLDPSGSARPTDSETPAYRVASRAQALGLLDSVQRYFRHSEPSSPIPMLCERARALAERDFMGVLEDVLPKSALKALNNER